MATTTAIIIVGKAHQNHSGIIPSHYILFTENDKPALILNSMNNNNEKRVIIPTVENTIDDIYLMIAVYILKEITPSKDLHSPDRTSLHEILSDDERHSLYEEVKKLINTATIKVVFNILDDSHLLRQIELIKNYPNDFEVTLPSIKKEYDAWHKQVITKGI